MEQAARGLDAGRHSVLEVVVKVPLARRVAVAGTAAEPAACEAAAAVAFGGAAATAADAAACRHEMQGGPALVLALAAAVAAVAATAAAPLVQALAAVAAAHPHADGAAALAAAPAAAAACAEAEAALAVSLRQNCGVPQAVPCLGADADHPLVAAAEAAVACMPSPCTELCGSD